MPQTNLRKAREKAARIGVTVRPSRSRHKKLDVFDRSGRKVASIGDRRYSDFNQHGDLERRRLYKARHARHRHRRGSPSYYADRILW